MSSKRCLPPRRASCSFARHDRQQLFNRAKPLLKPLPSFSLCILSAKPAHRAGQQKGCPMVGASAAMLAAQRGCSFFSRLVAAPNLRQRTHFYLCDGLQRERIIAWSETSINQRQSLAAAQKAKLIIPLQELSSEHSNEGRKNRPRTLTPLSARGASFQTSPGIHRFTSRRPVSNNERPFAYGRLELILGSRDRIPTILVAPVRSNSSPWTTYRGDELFTCCPFKTTRSGMRLLVVVV
jgi:hypothetical protein